MDEGGETAHKGAGNQSTDIKAVGIYKGART